MLFAAWLSDVIISIEGMDADKYLQGQMTSDISALKNNTAQITAHCNPQGRIISLGYLIKKNYKYFYIIPKETSELALKHLKKFILRAKVKIDLSSTPVIGLMGNFPEKFELSPELSEGDLFKIDETRGFLISPFLPSKAKEIEEAAWLKNQLENKTAFLNKTTQEKFLPDEIKLANHSHGVCFTKGCFIGQEIIARMHYLGRSKNYLNLKISEDLSLKSLDNFPDELNSKIICQVIFNQKNYCLILSKNQEAPS